MSTGSSSWIRKEKRLAIYLRDGFRCLYCFRDLHGADPREVTLDHLNAKHTAGHNTTGNLVTACLKCNSSRKDMPWKAFVNRGEVFLWPEEVIRRIQGHRRRKLGKYKRLARDIIHAAS
jgi:5-methylcytosine-specific restriction endonuclease McrA